MSTQQNVSDDLWQEILHFWYEESRPEDWFQKSDAFDQKIKERFLSLHQRASQCELEDWRKSPEGTLAEVIVLDQFSRNIFRDQPKAFAQDALALALSQRAIEMGQDLKMSQKQRWFLYLPFMHSESLKIHNQAVNLFKSLDDFPDVLDFEYKHKVIIERFGRYPHRNKVLGRTSTPEEEAFLKEAGSSF